MGGEGRRKGLMEGTVWGRGERGEEGGEEAVPAFRELTIQQTSTGQFKSNKSMNAKQCNRQ